MTAVSRAPFPYWAYGLALVGILFIALAPVGGVFLSSWLAETHNCSISEASAEPCMILGADWGGALYTMFVMGWFALATLPLGGGALIVWVIIFIMHRLAWRRIETTDAP